MTYKINYKLTFKLYTVQLFSIKPVLLINTEKQFLIKNSILLFKKLYAYLQSVRTMV